MGKIGLQGATAILVALHLLSESTFAKDNQNDFGKREFEAKCASCHGANGKGLSQSANLLRGKPPLDLTTLKKNNQGIFPINRVYESITGQNVAGHGSRDMPLWGDEYLATAKQNGFDAETWARIRLLVLIEYIQRLQR